jgi:hypothetical protein
VLHRVFEPFFTTKKDKGTGLGLSRVYGYAMQLGGNVTAKNGASGGAEVTLYIPSAGKAGKDEQELEIHSSISASIQPTARGPKLTGVGNAPWEIRR